MHTTSRRSLFGSGASLVLLSGGLATPANADGHDAELIRNCAKLVAMEAEWRAAETERPECDMPGRQDGYYDLVDAVTNTPAQTDAGNRAKLAVAVSFYDPDPPGDSIVSDMLWDAALALALPLKRDILGKVPA